MRSAPVGGYVLSSRTVIALPPHLLAACSEAALTGMMVSIFFCVYMALSVFSASSAFCVGSGGASCFVLRRRLKTFDPNQNPHAASAEPKRAGKLALRIFGGAGLFLALCLALLRDGPSFGAMIWVTMISLAALAVAFTLRRRPRLLRLLAALVCRGRRDHGPGRDESICEHLWG